MSDSEKSSIYVEAHCKVIITPSQGLPKHF